MANIDKQLIEEILGQEADALINYVQRVSDIATDDQNKRFIIFMCRRCLITFDIIRHICLNLTDSKNILSNEDLYCLKPEDSAIVIDDIIIHGRTVKRLYENLRKQNILTSVSAFYKKYNAEFLDSDILNSYEYICGRDVTETEWHDLSNRLINLIIRSRIPYTTFTYSFAFEEGEAINQPEKYDIVDISQTLFKNNGLKMSVYFDKQYKTNFTLLGQLCNCVCIREYKDNNNAEFVYIPFVSIPSLNKNVFKQLAESNQSDLPRSVVKIFVSDVYSAKYKAMLLSFLLSYAYGLVSVKNKRIDKQRTLIIKSIISKSFSTTFDDVIGLTTEQCYKILNISLKSSPSTEEFESNNADFYTAFNFNCTKAVNCMDLIANALSELHKENEKRAKDKRESSWGFKVADMLNVFVEKDDYDAIGALISMWDVGKATYYFKEYGNTVYGCVADGEQAYRIDYQFCLPYTRSILLLNKYMSFCKNYLQDKIWDDYFNYLKTVYVDLGLPCDYPELINKTKDLLENQSIADLNADGLEIDDSESKLYERTLEFLKSKM